MVSRSESDGTSPLRPEEGDPKGTPAARAQHGATRREDHAAAQSVPSSGRAREPEFMEALPAPSELRDHAGEQIAYYRRRARTSSLLTGGSSVILGAGVVALIVTWPDTKSAWIDLTCVLAAIAIWYSFMHFLEARERTGRNPGSGSPQWPVTGRGRRPGSGAYQNGQDDASIENQILINKYHELTTRQAATSYRNTQVAMLAGLALLATGTVIAVRSKSEPVQVVVGALTGLSSTISAYLGRTFIRMHERALLQMNYYFGHPLVNSYIISAERLSRKLSKDKRDEALSSIIAETLHGASSASRALSPETQKQTAKRKSRSRSGTGNGAAHAGDQS